MPLTRLTKNIDIETNVLDVIKQKANECFDKADLFFGNKFKRSLCNLKQKGRAAGTAHLHKNELRFNAYMYDQDPVEFINTVVPHEVAHIIVFQIYGNTVKPHGKEWKAVMLKVFGITPNRTHTFEVPPQKVVFEYRCSCQGHHFTKQRHNRAQRGVEYICKVCRSSLQFVSK